MTTRRAHPDVYKRLKQARTTSRASPDLPAALSHGIGSETQRPLALVIVGGIVSATLFTLLLLPTLFPLFEQPAES